MFGGIYEITKELNDFMLFDFTKNKWITLFEETVSPKKVMQDYSFAEEGSPGSPKKSTTSPQFGRKTTLGGRKVSPPKTSGKAGNYKSGGSSPVKRNLNITMSSNNGQPNSRNTKPNLTGMNTSLLLTTPTSISMMNSFIIKNADSSFDQYYS